MLSDAGLYPGLTENDIAVALDNALRAVGMEPFFDIVLFGLFLHSSFFTLLHSNGSR